MRKGAKQTQLAMKPRSQQQQQQQHARRVQQRGKATRPDRIDGFMQYREKNVSFTFKVIQQAANKLSLASTFAHHSSGVAKYQIYRRLAAKASSVSFGLFVALNVGAGWGKAHVCALLFCVATNMHCRSIYTHKSTTEHSQNNRDRHLTDDFDGTVHPHHSPDPSARLISPPSEIFLRMLEHDKVRKT